MRWRDIGVVGNFHAAFERGAQGLRSQEDVAHSHAGYDKELLTVAERGGHQLRLLRRPPARVHKVLKFLGKRLEPRPILFHRNQLHVPLCHERFQLSGSPHLDVAPADLQQGLQFFFGGQLFAGLISIFA
jgi:hypothetical protein